MPAREGTYGLLAEFDTPGDLVRAARKAHEDGWRRMDCYTPYPVEEAAEAIGFLRGARLTVLALQRGKGLPWHRVVAAGGRIALRGEEGREQRLRLAIEGVTFRGGRVRMDLHGWAPRYRGSSPRTRGRRAARGSGQPGRGRPPWA